MLRAGWFVRREKSGRSFGPGPRAPVPAVSVLRRALVDMPTRELVRSPLLLAALILLFACGGSAQPVAVDHVRTSVPEVASAIRTIVAGDRNPASGPLTPAERKQLAALYSPVAEAALWVDADGRVTRQAVEALALLGAAADDGLDPAAYGVGPLQRLTIVVEGPHSPRDVAVFDTALSAGLLRYLRHLHAGRVDPRAHGFRTPAPIDDTDLVQFLQAARANGRIGEAAVQRAPPFALYRRLRRMLGRYRALAADPWLREWPPRGERVRPGDPYAAAGALQRYLVAFGDIPPDAPVLVDASTYEGWLVEGVRRFQFRHGLEPDGVLGPRTHAALRVPLAWRVRQIELALERLRWLPDLGAERVLAVSIPMFQLWTWNATSSDGAPAFGARVIVGRARRTPTPMFVAEMRHVVFRPYWNVPGSILRHEILPALERDPTYLEQHDMEIVSGPGDDARAVALGDDSVAQLRTGMLRLRQRPGPKNSLGLIKFVFPNDYDVYLHGTPAQQLFSRPRRDFSHGCVRVEDPVGLAEWVLGEQPEWSRDRILAAMNASSSRQVNLTQPIRVLMFYMTAVVMPEDDTIRFAEDIYSHDAALDNALARLRTVD